MFGADVLTFREFMMGESLPLSTVQNAVLEFLQGREDAVLFGAQAVNAYVREPRMTQDIDILSTHMEKLARALCDFLREKFQIAVRTRLVSGGRGMRIYQIQKEGNRHLVDVRQVDTLPAAERIAGVLVLAPAALIASKVAAYFQRRGQPKSGTDWRDLAHLLLTFPELKREAGPVLDHLRESAASPEVMIAWKEIAAQIFNPTDEEEEW